MQLTEFNKSARSLLVKRLGASARSKIMLKIGDKVAIKGALVTASLVYDVADETDKEGYACLSFKGNKPFKIHSSCLEKVVEE